MFYLPEPFAGEGVGSESGDGNSAIIFREGTRNFWRYVCKRFLTPRNCQRASRVQDWYPLYEHRVSLHKSPVDNAVEPLFGGSGLFMRMPKRYPKGGSGASRSRSSKRPVLAPTTLTYALYKSFIYKCSQFALDGLFAAITYNSTYILY